MRRNIRGGQTGASRLSPVVKFPFRHTLLLLLCGLFLSCAAVSTWEPPSDLRDSYDVTIYRDTWGVPHIYGTTDADVAFGLAYAHAEDDLENIELSLIAARGIMASRGGLAHLPVDFLVKLFRLKETVEEKYEKDLSPEVRRLCEMRHSILVRLPPGSIPSQGKMWLPVSL